jgi:hypothetical protein
VQAKDFFCSDGMNVRHLNDNNPFASQHTHKSNRGFSYFRTEHCKHTTSSPGSSRLFDESTAVNLMYQDLHGAIFSFEWRKRTYGARPGSLSTELRVGSASEGGSLRANPFLPKPWIFDGFWLRGFWLQVLVFLSHREAFIPARNAMLPLMPP